LCVVDQGARLLNVRIQCARGRFELEQQAVVSGFSRTVQGGRLHLTRRGSSWLLVMALTAATSPAALSKVAINVVEAAGSGVSLKVALTMAARLPNEPLISFPRSYPATFFTTLPPDLISGRQ
jgi:hypothetical protein